MRSIPTISEVVAAYRPRFREELAGDWASVVLYRPVSFVMTPLFVAASIPATAVTLLALACTIALPWLAAAGGSSAALWVGVLGIVFCVLDCVDGNIARVTGRATVRGAYFDSLGDILYRVSMYASIGLLVDAAPAQTGAGSLIAFGPSAGLVTALACALLSVIARLCRVNAELAQQRGNAVTSADDRSPPGSLVFSFLSGLENLVPIAVVILGAMDQMAWLLACLVPYSLGDFLLSQKSALARLR